MDSRIALIAEMTQIEYDGRSFNGPPLLKTLDGLSLEQVTSKKTVEEYSVWGIVLHLIYWKYSLARELGGTGGFDTLPFEVTDWPPVPDQPTAAEWKTVLDHQNTCHNAYIETLKQFPGERLDEILPEWKVTYLRSIAWMATHDLYHAAQIRNMGIPK